MNIETANRLYELRKKNNLSQEELADKLGISRQAVSKWERAEASPDTDNLILLAKLYGVTLDELLNSNGAEGLVEENAESENAREGIQIDGDNVSITDDEGQTLKIEDGHIHCYDKDGNEVKKSDYKDPISAAVFGASAVLATLAYIILGFTTTRGWSSYWTLFLIVPVVGTFVEAIRKKQLTAFAFPVLVTAVYCFMGMRFYDMKWGFGNVTFYGFWHPLWVLYLLVPIYYIICDPIDKYVFKTKKEENYNK